jgi:hypothetical protein
MSDDPDLEYALIDGTIVQVHQKATGAKPSHRCKQRLPGDRGLKITPLGARAAG